MIFTRKLLNEFLDLTNVTNSKIAEDLTSLGFETTISKDFLDLHEGIKIAEIIEFKIDPKKSKLKIVKIKSGNNFYQVVCGANNFQIGDFVIWAPPGSTLNLKEIKIKSRKFGTILSEGMLCSKSELKIEDKSFDEIFILPKNKKIKKISDENNQKHPFIILNYDNAIFDSELHFGAPETHSVYGLSLYLKRKWENNQLKKKETFWINKTGTNQILEFFVFENVKTSLLPSWLVEFVNAIGTKEKNFLKILNEYIKKMFGIDVILKSLDVKGWSSLENSSIEFLKTKLIVFNFQKKIHCFIFENQKKTLPSSDFYKICLNFLKKKLIKNDFIIKQKFFPFVFSPKKSDEILVYKNFLKKIISPNFDSETMEKYLNLIGFTWTEFDNNQLKINCPFFQKFNHANDIAEEIIKFYGIQNLEEISINFPLSNSNSSFLKIWKNVRNFLLNKNFDEVKTEVLEKQEIKKTTDRIRESIIPNLIEISNELKKNIFTIDTIFLNENEKFLENKVLSILITKPFFTSSILKQNSKQNKPLLINLLQNIFELLNLSINSLWKEDNLLKINELKWIKTMKKKFKKIFWNITSEKIWYNNFFIGYFGEINFKKNEKTIKNFYIEINFDLLVQIFNDNSNKLKFEERTQKNWVFRDFSINFDNDIDKKINLIIKNYQKIDYSYLGYWVMKLKNLDKNILKIEIIDIYKNKIVTFRFWIKSNSIKKQNENFSKLEMKLATFINVKIK